MGPKFKKIWNVFTTILVVLVVLLAALLVGARLFGLEVRYVMTGSMEPTYHVGSLIYIKKINPADVKIGDPITFVLKATDSAGRHISGTHRVVDIREVGDKEVTDERTGKSHTEYCYDYLQLGDAVNPEYNPDYMPDKAKFPDYRGYDNANEATREAVLKDSVDAHASWVSSANLIGKPVFTIPVLGHVAKFVQNAPGMYIAVAAGAVLLLLVFMPDLIGGKKKRGAKTAVPAESAETENPAPSDKGGK